jgi:Predicted pPIWI-associating nuclease
MAEECGKHLRCYFAYINNPATTSSDNGAMFGVIVTHSSQSVASSLATLTVNSPLAITSQPANQTVVAGQTATFSVVANGTSPLTYQWQKNLDHLAPDTDVEAQDWYKPEQGRTKPTMKQKTAYILISRERNKTQTELAEKTVGLIDELSGEVMRAVYNRASLATHVHQSRAEVQRIKRYVDTMLFDLLEVKQ